VTWVGRITFNLGAKSTDVNINKTTVAKVSVTPHMIEEMFATKDSSWVLRKFTQQSEFCFRQVQFSARAQNFAFIGNDLKVAEYEFRMGGVSWAGSTQQCSNPCREFFRREWLGEVIVCAGFEASDNIMGIGSCCHHDDWNIAGATNRTTQFKTIYSGQHDVNEDDIGWLTQEQNGSFFSTCSFVDGPAFVFERQLDGGANSFIIFNCKDSCSHAYILPYGRAAAGTSVTIL
jgi:hypothetical protein